MVGTYEDAKRALNFDLDYVSCGTSREVFRSGDVVYKVEFNSEFGANAAEFDNYQNLCMLSLSPELAIPEASLYEVDGHDIIAMQYIDGQPMAECYCNTDFEDHDETCLPAEISNIVRQYLDDTGGQNVIFDGEKYWLIDLEC